MVVTAICAPELLELGVDSNTTRSDKRGSTTRRVSEGPVMGYVSTLMSIQSAFEKAGIIFQDEDAGGGIGVRLAAPKT